MHQLLVAIEYQTKEPAQVAQLLGYVIAQQVQLGSELAKARIQECEDKTRSSLASLRQEAAEQKEKVKAIGEAQRLCLTSVTNEVIRSKKKK